MSEAVLVLKSGRCSWGKCMFCGFGRIHEPKLGFGKFKEKLDSLFKEKEVSHLKIYGSGSFFDDDQFSERIWRYLVEKARNRDLDRLTVESRPGHISREKLDLFLGKGFDLEVAIGLEAADDELLNRLNKGFSVSDFEEKAELVRKSGAKVRTYLLVNPPFINDLNEHMKKSAEYALEHSDTVVLINLLPHGNTPLFEMWVSGEWTFLSKEEFFDLTKEYHEHPKVELEPENFRFVPKFPSKLREDLTGVGERYLTHPHFEVWQDYLTRWFQPAENKKVLLFLPCSKTKPYSKSRTHRLIRRYIGYRGIVHEVMISNAGLIPREFESYYPFADYDWDESKENPEVKRRYIQVTKERIVNYLTSHPRYERILSFLAYDSESFKALEKSSAELDMDFNNLVKEGTERLLEEENLRYLKRNLENEIMQIQEK